MTHFRPSRSLRPFTPGSLLTAVITTILAVTILPPDAMGTTGTTGTTEADSPERAPLLREGSTLVDASGTMQTSRQTGAWDIEISAPNAELPPHRLTLLPSVHLGELMHVLGAAGGSGARVMVTGTVYEFDGENYLLLAHPAKLLAPSETTTDDSLAPPPGQPPARPETQPTTTRPDETTRPEPDDSTEQIIRDLQEGIGPISHRPETASPTVAPGLLVPEGAVVVRRRGQVRRTASGGYLFIFDSDTTGQADPPMLLLPCRLLKHIDRHLRKSPRRRTPMLLTGHVMSCQGRNYLLPTVYQIPRERTQLSPAGN